MSSDNTNEERDEVDVEDESVRETSIDAGEDEVTVEEELTVEGDSLSEEVTVEEGGEEELTVEEDLPVETGRGGRKRIKEGRKRLEAEADRAVEGFDQGIVDLLAWVLDTETRARIYVYLRQHPASTSEEIAEGTGLYPSTVREALAELHTEGKVDREKRENEGAGNNPYEYTAIAPSELVGGVVQQVQDQLNTVFNLDDHIGTKSKTRAEHTEPVSITVESEPSEDATVEAEGTEPTGETDEANEAGRADDTADDGSQP